MYLLKPIRSNRYNYLFNTSLIVLIGYINYSENRQLSEGASLHELYFSLGISPTSSCSDYRKKNKERIEGLILVRLILKQEVIISYIY